MAAVAAEAARAASVVEAQAKLSSILKSDKAGTIAEYGSAQIIITSAASLARINAEVLKLPASDRSDLAKIKAIVEKIEFDERFFNATARPTVATYVNSGVTVTARTLAAVNASVLELPSAMRTSITAIAEIAKAETFVDRVANPITRGTVTSTEFVKNGVLPANSPYKFSVVQGLARYPEASLNSLKKLQAVIKEVIEKIEAPKRRLAEIKAKIAARKR